MRPLILKAKSKAAKKLVAYLRKDKINVDVFAESVGTCRRSLSRYITGDKMIPLKIAINILRKTKIKAQDWLEY